MPGDFMRNAAAFGYPVEHGEAVILDAFRQRFRPTASGPIGPADLALMAGLARRTVQRDLAAMMACLRWEARAWPDPRQRGLDRLRCPEP